MPHVRRQATTASLYMPAIKSLEHVVSKLHIRQLRTRSNSADMATRTGTQRQDASLHLPKQCPSSEELHLQDFQQTVRPTIATYGDLRWVWTPSKNSEEKDLSAPLENKFSWDHAVKLKDTTQPNRNLCTTKSDLSLSILRFQPDWIK